MKVKNIFKISIFVIILLGVFASCQKEEQQYVDDTNDETITVNSVLTGRFLSASQNDGIIDNIIDSSSCTSVVLPVTVIANGQQLSILSIADFDNIQAIFDLNPNDNDTLEIVFPISLMFENYMQVEVSNQAGFDTAISDCINQIDDTYSCVDFEYPISCFIYNTLYEQTGVVTMATDIEWFEYLEYLNESIFIAIDYPITMIADGVSIEINTNEEAIVFFEQVDCPLNIGGNTIDPVQFEEDLTNGVWYVGYFFDDYDETSDFAGYEFTFSQDNTAVATNGAINTDGTWMYTQGSNSMLDLFFGNNPPLDELDEDWEIIESSIDIVRLRNLSSDGSLDYLTFDRTPNTGGSNNQINLFIELLTTGVWYVNLFEESGTNTTCNYQQYEFTYFLNGTVTAVENATTINGFWSVEDNGSTFDLILNFDNSGSGSPLGDLNDDWNVLEGIQTLIRLEDSSGGSSDLLNFGRDPFDCGGGGGGSPDPQELRDIMESGTWFIQTFLDDGDDETSDYSGYNYNFYTGTSVIANNGSQSVYGIWVVTVVFDELNFEFDMDSPINGTDDDEYKVLQFTQTSVTFVTRDSNGNIEDTLIINKN